MVQSQVTSGFTPPPFRRRPSRPRGPTKRLIANGGPVVARVLLCGLLLGIGCTGDSGETQLREVLTQYVRLQGVQIANGTTYASTVPAGLSVPPEIEFLVLGGSPEGHAALAFRVARRDFVCAVRVGAVRVRPVGWDLGAVPSNGQPVCGRREVVLQPPAADAAQTLPAEETLPPPAYAYYFPLIAGGAELPLLVHPARRAEVVQAITHALTHTAEDLEQWNQRLGQPGASPWRGAALRTEARRLIIRLDDPALLPVLIHSLITAEEGGRRGEFRNIQSQLVTVTGVDSAPFYVESTPANRRAAEVFWTEWWASTGPRPFASSDRAFRARQRWQRTGQMRAWAADPPSWREVMEWGGTTDLDSETKEAVREVVRVLLTDAPEAVAQRMNTIPGEVANLRTQAARYVRTTRDTSLVPTLIAALTVPDPDLYRGRHDSVFLGFQETLVSVTAADSAPRYARGSATNREAAAAFWRDWWRAADGRAPFPTSIEAQQVLQRWEVLSRQHTPADWLDLLSQANRTRDVDVGRAVRSVAMQIVTLPYDSLVRLSSGNRDPDWAAHELLEQATYRLRGDYRPDVVSALILSLERGPTAESRAEAVNEAEGFYRMQEALVRQTGIGDAPYFGVPSRAARDSASSFWRNRWSTDSAGWRPPADRRAVAVAARWAASRAVPVLSEEIALWLTMLTALPLNAGEVQQALRPVVLELVTLPQEPLQARLADLGSPLSIELAASLGFHALMFARVYPHATFVAPLIERVGRAEGAGAAASQRFEQIQMALVATSGLGSAPRYTVARSEALRDAQRYWSDWWRANEPGFTPADSADAVDAVHIWLNRRSR